MTHGPVLVKFCMFFIVTVFIKTFLLKIQLNVGKTKRTITYLSATEIHRPALGVISRRKGVLLHLVLFLCRKMDTYQ